MAQTEGSCFIASYIRSTKDSYSGENTHQVTARVTAIIKRLVLQKCRKQNLFFINFLLNVWNGVAIFIYCNTVIPR